MTTVVITGATGYIGRRLVRAAVARGFEVIAASRSDPGDEGARWLRYRLEDDVDTASIPPGAIVIHLAADTASGGDDKVARETASARRLLAAAHDRRARVVFVSSQAARRDAPTAYGRAKWEVEQRVLQAGGTSVRPGLVYGGPAAGLFGQLLSQVRSSLAIPALLPAPQVQPIHVDDLVDGLLRVAERDDLSGKALNLASAEPVPFTTVLQTMATLRLRCRRIFVPVPIALIGPLVRVANTLLRRGIDPGRVRSLIDLPPMASAADLQTLGLKLRPLSSGMHPSGNDRRRRLLREGRALIGYVLGERVPPELLRRYVRAVERLRNRTPVAMPAWLLDRPRWIAALDGPVLSQLADGGELRWRLEAATVLAEASPQGAPRFLWLDPGAGVVAASGSFARAALSEAMWRLARPVSSPLLRRAFRTPQ